MSDDEFMLVEMSAE